jgi:F-type H+-transporting ATPase subunit b
VHFSLTTFLLQTVNFLVLVWVLRRFLFRPVQRIVDQRRKQIADAMGEAERTRAALASVDQEIETRRADAAAALGREAAALRRQAEGERQTVLDGARARADAVLTDARAQLEREREEALTGLERRAARLAAALAGNLVQRGGAEAVTTALLEQALVELARQPPGARDRLLGDTPRASRLAIRVVSARPLGDEARARCRAALGRVAGEPLDVDFADDETLLAGVEIHFPHTVVRHSWREQLGEAARSLVDGAGARDEATAAKERHGEPAGVA